jgi:hypothetical protein
MILVVVAALAVSMTTALPTDTNSVVPEKSLIQGKASAKAVCALAEKLCPCHVNKCAGVKEMETVFISVMGSGGRGAESQANDACSSCLLDPDNIVNCKQCIDCHKDDKEPAKVAKPAKAAKAAKPAKAAKSSFLARFNMN